MPVVYRIPYHHSTIEFRLPSSMHGSLALSHPSEPLEDVKGAIQETLAHPVGSPGLRQLAKKNERVCIVFTDSTRLAPNQLLLPALLRELELAGVDDDKITLLCGIGMHRPSTIEEKKTWLGSEKLKRYKVIDNQAQNQDVQVDLGFTKNGVPVVVNRSTVEADLLIATGVVEPHQYAGYSGGRKTAAIGAGGEKLIAYTHGPAFIDHPGTRLGRIDGNPFHEAIHEVAKRAGLRFILNVVMDDNGKILRVAAGEPEATFKQLVEFARSVYETNIPHQYDIAIGGVGYPKDVNLYQATRAASYLFFAPTPVVRPGGFLIITACCEEGAGAGIGEKRFLEVMQSAPDVQTILEDARRNGYPPGGQRGFVMAKVLEKNPVVVVGSVHREVVEACKMIHVETMEQALDLAAERLGKSCQVLIVPHALHTLPVVEGVAHDRECNPSSG